MPVQEIVYARATPCPGGGSVPVVSLDRMAVHLGDPLAVRQCFAGDFHALAIRRDGFGLAGDGVQTAMRCLLVGRVLVSAAAVFGGGGERLLSLIHLEQPRQGVRQCG